MIADSVNSVEKDADTTVVTLKRKRDVNPTYMWHLTIGSTNMDMINRLVRDRSLDLMNCKLSKYHCPPLLLAPYK